MLLIKCEIELRLSWPKNCIISEIFKTPEMVIAAFPTIPHAPAASTTSALFQINSTKFYVLIVSLSINDNIEFLENSKQGFKRRISWSKYRPEIIMQPKKKKIWII